MTTNIFRVALIILISTSISLVEPNAQNCRDFERRCKGAPGYFEASSLSRSVTLRKARRVIINQTFYGGTEYFISVCGRDRLGKIHFRLIASDESNTILYDNAADDFNQTQLFVIKNTMAVKIELSAPHFFDPNSAECAGIRISYHRSVK